MPVLGLGALRARFPARPVAARWPRTGLPPEAVLRVLGNDPFVVDTKAGEDNRRRRAGARR